MILGRSVAAFSCLLLLSGSALAYDLPTPEGFVTDQAGVFSYEEELALELKVQEIEDGTTAEIAILTIASTGGEDISQLAFEVGNEWGVGKEENDNGLVILIAVEDRAWFMATGYGLEGALPDAITKRIAQKHFPVYFRDGLYADGLDAVLSDIQSYLENDPSVVAQYGGSGSSIEDDSSSVVWFIILFFFAILKSGWVGASRKKLNASLVSNGLITLLGLAMSTAVLTGIVLVISILIDLSAIFGGKGGGSGKGRKSSKSSWWSGGSGSSWGGSSGGGGFGGGSFGGGGSGGRW